MNYPFDYLEQDFKSILHIEILFFASASRMEGDRDEPMEMENTMTGWFDIFIN